MSRVFITGDVHGSTDISKLQKKNFPEQKHLTKDDYLIVCGDFGVIWTKENKDEIDNLNFFSKRKYTSIIVLGNHENYDRIEKLPEVEMFGGVVWECAPTVYILKRGAVYTIAGKTFFTMGGALSTDRAYNPARKPGAGWWEQEIPSAQEFQNGLDALDENDYKVDYVITHTAPARVIQQYMNACADTYVNELKGQFDSSVDIDMNALYDRVMDDFIDKEYYNERKDAVARYFDPIVFGERPLVFKRWFFGHFHGEWTSKDGRFVLTYRRVTELDLNDDK